MQNKIIKVAFMAPSTKWWPYYLYKEIVEWLNKKYWNKLDVHFFNTKSAWFKLHFTKYDYIFSVIPFLFKPLKTKKYYYNIHGNFETERKRKNIWNKLLYLARFNIYFCDKIVLNSMFLSDKLRFNYKYKDKIIIIPNHINLEEKELKIKKIKDKECLNLLTVSSTKFLEKWMWIIDLWQQISKIKNKKIKWTIIAWWDKQNKYIIEKDFKKIKFNKNISINWIGWIEQSNLQSYYKNADIFIYWTRLDTRWLTIMEAMSYGLPIILLKYELWKYIYPEIIITNNIEYKLKDIIKNYIQYSKISIDFLKNKYSLNKVSKEIFKLL